MTPQIHRTGSEIGFWLAGLMFLAAGSSRADGTGAGVVTQFHKDVQPLLENYCYECHGDGMSNGGVAFDELKSNDEILNRDLWGKVIKNLRTGIMPPHESATPRSRGAKGPGGLDQVWRLRD